MSRDRVEAGSIWGDQIGYSRALRTGNLVFVSGTTATGPDGKAMNPGDSYAQTKEVLRRIELALTQLGLAMADVVQTRMFVADISRWEEIGRAHGEVFRESKPATSMIEVSRLIDPDLMIEMEAVAVADDGP